jgi:hypothetical protein
VTVCILSQGEPKTGKTGALASLLDAGYRVILADWDGNPDSARLNTSHPENLHVVSFQDDLDVNDKGELVRLNRISAVRQFTKFLVRGNEELGPPSSWDPERTVLACDSGSAMADSAMALAVRLNESKDGRVIYQLVQDEISDVLHLFKKLPCHRVMICHLKLIAPKGEERSDSELQKQIKREIADLQETKFYPNFPGRQLSMTCARLFSTAVLFEVNRGKRMIRTQPVDGYTIGVPVKVEDRLPIETGLADLFKALGHQL